MENSLSKLFIFFSFVISILHSAETIRITNGEWAPYNSENSYEFGFASHIVKKAFAEEGIFIKWGFFPWKRSFNNAQNGAEWDASAVWGTNEEIEKDFWVSDTVVMMTRYLFYRKDMEFEWQNINDLQKWKIGLTRGYFYKCFVDTANFDIEYVSTDEQNFKKLLARRIDIFPVEFFVGKRLLNEIFDKKTADSITFYPKAMDQKSLHLIISKQCPEGEFFLEKFNQGLQKLQKNGKLEKMFQDFQNGKYD